MRKIFVALAFGALLLPDYGYTLGLGEIEVTTALNQELNAEIELISALPEDVETLIVKLASREEFNRAGIDRPYMLNSLKFSAELRNGQPFIRVTSEKPIREPFLNFLIEIDWPKGHMMREYTILLDPPVFMQQPAPAQQEQMRPAAMESSRPLDSGSTPGPQGDSGFRPAAMGSAATTAPSVPVSVPKAQTQAMAESSAVVPAYTQSYQPPSGYRIQQGDTLWSLADSMRPDQSVTIEQMMLAMLRSNPEAFINENVNGLKRGYILRIPDRDDIITLDQAEAVAMVREQNALWRQYQQAVAGGEPGSAMEREAEDDEGAGMVESTEAHLEILAAGTGMSASASKDPTQMSSRELRAELALSRESLETERVEKEELQQRVDSLEGQVNRMKSLLTLEDSDLAEMQQAATPVEAEVMPEGGLAEEVMVEEQLEAVMEEAADLEAIMEAEEATLEELSAEEGAEQELFVDEQQAAEEQVEFVEEIVEQQADLTEDFSVTPYTEPAFMQKQNPLTAILNNPTLLAAAGGGLVLLLLLVALIMKRRKSGGDDEALVVSNLEDIADQIDDRDVIREVEDERVKQEMAAAEAEAGVGAVEQELNTQATGELTAEGAVVTPPEAAADEEPRDDIIAEADVYLAYGIYQQAEELLQNALKDNPDKDSYRVKLAETYLAGKNSDAFIELASDMNQRRAGEDTPAWRKIVAIGKQLAPDHDLFAGAAVGESSMDEPSSEAFESSDIGRDSDEEQQAIAPDLDLSFDESEAGIVDTEQEHVFDPGESVEFDLTETGAETIEEAEAAGVAFDITETQSLDAVEETGEFSLDIEAAELGIDELMETEGSDDGEFGLDLSAEAEAALGEGDETADVVSLDDIDEASLDFESGNDQPVEQSLDENADIIDFTEELAEKPKVAELEPQPTPYSASMDDDLDLSSLDDIDEVSTKLDLAKAYLDMGDADGTRSILDEVMTEGNDDQKKEADELLRQLG